MRNVKPRVFLVAETNLLRAGMDSYLRHIGAPDWDTDAKSDSETLIEFMGRACYKSFKPGLNPNVTKVREGNDKYLAHIVDVGHGSVCEHASVSFMFTDVSRVFTHELVRHRAGTAMSQESLRFVRLDDLGFWAPTCIRENAEALEIMSNTFATLEGLQIRLAELFDLDNPDVPFSTKKMITSAMRRIAPIGLATAIGWTANLRTLRHVLEMRTHPAAEEEIRIVFGEVGTICQHRYPALFADYEVTEENGHPWFQTANRKI